MAQVLHMESAFPGKPNPTSPMTFGAKDQDMPYSVETPYGYRLDLDFLKYVDDIEKGHTIKRVHVHRKPRFSSLPRGYTGSWWTSTESLCSNASMDSRHSSFSYCGRSFYPAYSLENRPPLITGLNARVEKTLLDAKKKLEADHGDAADGGRARLSSFGSLHGSRSGSTSSLVGAGLNSSFSKQCSQNGSQHGTTGVYTPMSSGLSTPVTPTPGHLQHVREQMAVALRKLKQLEEQVKMIPVLQVKISVLQEEKRQLSVQLKSQRFLGHLGSYGKTKSRGELYIDIPEEESDRGRQEISSSFQPSSSRQDSGCETGEGSMTLSPQPVQKKEVKSVCIGTEESDIGKASASEARKVLRSSPEVRSLGVSVKEQDLGISSMATNAEVDKQRQMIQALSAKIAVLEKQLRKALQELQAAHQKLDQHVKSAKEKGQNAKPAMADATSMTSGTWQEALGEHYRGSSHGGQQHNQRTVGVQVYSTEHPLGVLWKHQEVPVKVDTVKVVQTPREPEIAASTATGVHMKPQRAQSLENKESYITFKAFQAKEPEGPNAKRQLGKTTSPESPFTIYRTDEVMETAFPRPTSPTSNIFHIVKKISITSFREGTGDGMSPAEGKESFEVLQKSKVSCEVPISACPDVIKAAKELTFTQQATQHLSQGAAAESVAGEQRRISPGQEEEDSDSSQAGIRSIMKKKEEGAESPTTKKSLQFVGVNGGYESTSSEDSSTAENVSDNESTESEYHEASEGVPSAGAESERRNKEMLRLQATTTAPATTVAAATATTVVTAATVAAATTVATAAATATGSSARVSEENSTRGELSRDLISACITLQKCLENRAAVTDSEMKTAYTTVLQEWLRILRLQEVDTEVVRHHMALFRAMSPQLLEYIINMADGNGNTALHYTVSQSNFAVVKMLLDTGLCNVDKQNKAGYTAIMLTALAAFRSESDMDTVLQMLRLGNVNSKASQAGQTALMLAVSHGRLDMVKALLACHADVNSQDDDGSTALMCACEHGHVDIVRVLLATPGCDVALTDNDGSTALSIALEASQNDIAVLLYAHMNFAKPPSPSSSKNTKEEMTDSSHEFQ